MRRRRGTEKEGGGEAEKKKNEEKILQNAGRQADRGTGRGSTRGPVGPKNHYPAIINNTKVK